MNPMTMTVQEIADHRRAGASVVAGRLGLRRAAMAGRFHSASMALLQSPTMANIEACESALARLREATVEAERAERNARD